MSIYHRVAVAGLIWIATPAQAASPSASEVESAQQSRGGSCVMFTSGVCICDEYVPMVRDLTCRPAPDAGQFACSYNVYHRDVSGIGHSSWEQRVDQLALGPDQRWMIVKSLVLPKIF